MRNQALPQAYVSSPSPRMVSILSGKGGVGKSVIAFNLASALSAHGTRVLLVDADFGCGNLHLLANVAAEFGIGEYASQQLTLAEARLALAPNLDLLAGTWHESLGEDRTARFTATLVQRLRDDAADYDFIIVDHSSGRSNQVAMMAHASDLVLIVAIPELTSLSDAYGLYKHLNSLGATVECGLLVNRVQSDDEALFIADKFAALTGRFLNRPVSVVGAIPEEEIIRKSIAAQRSIFAINDKALASQAVSRLATDLCQGLSVNDRDLNSIKKDSATADTRG